MIVTKTGKCVICGVKVKEQCEFHAAPKLVDVPSSARPGLPPELVERIKTFRDVPILCPVHVIYEVRKITT